jgi:sortase A
MHVKPWRPLPAVLVTAAFFSATLVAHSLWIPLKAELAQWLMRAAWQEILDGELQARPWPWADTRPAAILKVPRFEIEHYVLEGNSLRNLAFGPVFASAAAAGNDRVISGHRDTHFHFLQQLLPGDRIILQTLAGTEEYAVQNSEVIDSRLQQLVLQPGVHRLSLVTCYPFNAAIAGGPLRYVVTALPTAERTLGTGLPTAPSG